MVNRSIYISSQVIQVQIFTFFLAGQIKHIQEELAHSFQFTTVYLMETLEKRSMLWSMHLFLKHGGATTCWVTMEDLKRPDLTSYIKKYSM